MYYSDQLVPTGELSNVGYPIMTNVENSYRAGIEISAALKPFNFLEWNMNTTMSRNKIRDFVESYIDVNSLTSEEIPMTRELGDVNIAYSPEVIINSRISLTPFTNFGIHLTSKYVGKQNFDNTNSDDRIIDPYFVNDIRIDYSFPLKNVEDITLQLKINNILNSLYESNAYGGNYFIDGEEYSWAYYFPQAGINYLLRLSLRF